MIFRQFIIVGTESYNYSYWPLPRHWHCLQTQSLSSIHCSCTKNLNKCFLLNSACCSHLAVCTLPASAPVTAHNFCIPWHDEARFIWGGKSHSQKPSPVNQIALPGAGQRLAGALGQAKSELIYLSDINPKPPPTTRYSYGGFQRPETIPLAHLKQYHVDVVLELPFKSPLKVTNILYRQLLTHDSFYRSTWRSE